MKTRPDRNAWKTRVAPLFRTGWDTWFEKHRVGYLVQKAPGGIPCAKSTEWDTWFEKHRVGYLVRKAPKGIPGQDKRSIRRKRNNYKIR